ncbi:MAG: hypothetical protein PF961_19395 [Planctomycetota bacterium]|jgi:hypothetical protein|nr:hypothetical protein [Planctomycetota bacterium]
MTIRLLSAFIAMLVLAGCTNRAASWVEKYPITEEHHSILDDDNLVTLDTKQLLDFRRSEIEQLFGPPKDKDLGFTRAPSPIVPTGPKITVQKDTWLYHSNQGGFKLLISFVDARATDYNLIALTESEAM